MSLQPKCSLAEHIDGMHYCYNGIMSDRLCEKRTKSQFQLHQLPQTSSMRLDPYPTCTRIRGTVPISLSCFLPVPDDNSSHDNHLHLKVFHITFTHRRQDPFSRFLSVAVKLSKAKSASINRHPWKIFFDLEDLIGVFKSFEFIRWRVTIVFVPFLPGEG